MGFKGSLKARESFSANRHYEPVVFQKGTKVNDGQLGKHVDLEVERPLKT